jgi:hypothetical protein
MEPIILALSGFSLLGVSSVLRRTATKTRNNMEPSNNGVHGRAATKLEFAKLETTTLLHTHVPALMSSKSSSLLQQ